MSYNSIMNNTTVISSIDNSNYWVANLIIGCLIAYYCMCCCCCMFFKVYLNYRKQCSAHRSVIDEVVVEIPPVDLVVDTGVVVFEEIRKPQDVEEIRKPQDVEVIV